MQERLRHLEDRLERLVASGWRTAAEEARSLHDEAAALTEAGLPQLGARLQAVADATGPAEALKAIALAMATIKLLRVRLAPGDPPPGEWKLITADPKKPKTDRLLPVSRFALGGGEVWACIKLRGTQPEELVLVTPPSDLEPGQEWLRRPLLGQLRWQARYPLGGAGEVQLCTLESARWDQEPAEDPLKGFREKLQEGKVREMAPLSGASFLLLAVDVAEANIYDWPDGPPTAALGLYSGKQWCLAWKEGALITPLALVQPGPGPAALVHLVAGAPTSPL